MVEETYVLVDRTVEHVVFLHHGGELRTQGHWINLADVEPIDQHTAFRRGQQSNDHFGERCLPRARRSGERDTLAGLDREAHVAEDKRVVRSVAKAKVLDHPRRT